MVQATRGCPYTCTFCTVPDLNPGFRFRPIDAGDRGVLVAVDWRKTARGDFRLPRGKPLILGGQPYEDGQLVVILEAE